VAFVYSISGAATVAAGAHRFYNHSGGTRTITKVGLSAGTAPSGTTSTPITGASLVADVNINGTSIWSTQGNRVNIQSGQNVGTQTTFNTTTIADGSYFTVDIDFIGSTTAGSDVTVTVWWS
jgi:hypothetical protein